MPHPLPPEDSQPWYRQFWPWFLIALPATVVVAGLSMVYIANRHADDLVVDEYYKNGLAINRQLEKKQQAQTLGLQAELEISADTVTVIMVGDVAQNNLLLQLSHPLESDRDFTVPLVRTAPNQFQGSLSSPLTQRWHWVLEAASESSWRLDGTLILP